MTLIITDPTNFQSQSPLFSVLPGEIRNEIFSLALMQFEDDTASYKQDSYWYRPGFTAPRKSNSALLRTCKAVYFEGQKVFWKELEWSFWFDRGPLGRSGLSDCHHFFRHLTRQAQQSLQKVRFFTQMYWLEDDTNLHRIFAQPQFRPTEMTITIRYSDWWYWEENHPLRMEVNWLTDFEGHSELRVLRIEYETLVSKKEEMMKIIMRNKEFKLPLRAEFNNYSSGLRLMFGEKPESSDGGIEDIDEGGGYLSAENTALKEWTWTGTSKVGGRSWEHHEGDTMDYIVVTDTWRYYSGKLSDMPA